MSKVKVKFWGVRGSVPTPLTSADLAKRISQLIKEYAATSTDRIYPDFELFLELRKQPLTYGGNTSCVEVRYGDHIFALDMGTGLRPFGNSLFPEMFQKKGIRVNFFISHVHWDHIQGLPFFGPLYINKETGITNEFNFFGGTDWQKNAEMCLRGQMDPPNFPVSFRELLKTTEMHFEDLYDMRNFSILGDDIVKVAFRKLNHPQETYGVRLQFPNGKVVAYTTDNEPYDPARPDPRLVSLAKNADLWITDCQYTREVYNGEHGGVCRHGWGHSYPEAVAKTALEANVKKVLLFHHDPGASDEQILGIENYTRSLIRHAGVSGIAVQAAYEGLEINL